MDIIPTQVHVSPKTIAEGDTGPQVVIGFASANFSQAVYMDAPTDPQEAVQLADSFYKAILESCAAAVKEWNNAQGAGTETEA